MHARHILALITLGSLLSGTAMAQGSLTPPPGPPVASMKTLDQLETRIPLVAGAQGVSISAAGTITISQPGSYYLTGNRTVTAPAVGISITSEDVTLDLNGFSLICKTGAGGVAISSSSSGLLVKNGTIRGGGVYDSNTRTFTPAGWDIGLSAGGFGSSAENLRVFNCGGTGIQLASFGSTATNCHVDQCNNYGISAQHVSHCTVNLCKSFGITTTAGTVSHCRVFSQLETAINSPNGTVSDSTGETWGTSTGTKGIAASTVHNSAGFSQNGTGIGADVISNSTGSSGLGTGLEAYVSASNCSGITQQGIGLKAKMATGCYGYSVSGAYGMDIAGTATGCRASRTGGTALRAAIAVSCTSENGTITAPQKHLGTP